MNLALFEPNEIGVPIPRGDRRVEHVVSVLRRKVGETFDAGVINGERGKATVTALNDGSMTISFTPAVEVSPAPPITLIVGLPRPQTARDILRDATSLGVGAIHFVTTDKAESSYAQSTLWSSGEWRRHVVAGAEQAFDTRLPEVTHGRSLGDTLANVRAASTGTPGALLALDNYEAPIPLYDAPLGTTADVTLAIGAERGWSPNERHQLQLAGFKFVHLGSRVLRAETAVIAALSVVRAKLRLG